MKSSIKQRLSIAGAQLDSKPAKGEDGKPFGEEDDPLQEDAEEGEIQLSPEELRKKQRAW